MSFVLAKPALKAPAAQCAQEAMGCDLKTAAARWDVVRLATPRTVSTSMILEGNEGSCF